MAAVIAVMRGSASARAASAWPKAEDQPTPGPEAVLAPVATSKGFEACQSSGLRSAKS